MRLTIKQLRTLLLGTASDIAIGEVHTATAWFDAAALDAFLARSRSFGL